MLPERTLAPKHTVERIVLVDTATRAIEDDVPFGSRLTRKALKYSAFANRRHNFVISTCCSFRIPHEHMPHQSVSQTLPSHE